MGALLVLGTLVWDETTQAGAAEQWLCAGYVAVEGTGSMVVNLPSSSHSAFFYLKNKYATPARNMHFSCTRRARRAHA